MSQVALKKGKRPYLVVPIICFFTVVFDGYDLGVFGATAGSILADTNPGWEAVYGHPEVLGVAQSFALVGMFIGTMVTGALTEVFGRRRVLILSVSWFSLGMIATALSPSFEWFMVLRFLVGLGLGALVPTCIALTVEFSPKKVRQLANAIMFAGYPIGGALASGIAMVALPAGVDFRVLFGLGAIPVLVLPFIMWKLPESIVFTAQRKSEEQARKIAERYGLVYDDIVEPEAVSPATAQKKGLVNFRALFGRYWLRSTVLFTFGFFLSLLLVYGINTWLPRIMTSAVPADRSQVMSIAFLLLFNLGAIIGGIGAAYLASRFGDKRVAILSFLVAAIAFVALTLPIGVAGLYCAAFVAGWGTIGTQTLLVGYCATHYPQHLSPSMLGWGLGVGRLGAITGPLLGGLLLAMNGGQETNLYMFAGIAILALCVISLIPRKRDEARTGVIIVEDATATH